MLGGKLFLNGFMNKEKLVEKQLSQNSLLSGSIFVYLVKKLLQTE